MPAKPPARKRRQYSPVEIRQALTVLAYYGGNAARASLETGVPAMTLKDWRNTAHLDVYQEIQEREGPKLEAIAAAQAREAIIRSSDVEHRIFDRLSQETEDLTTKELSELTGALQRAATAKGINTTKLLELTGRPTQIVEHRDPKQAAEALARRLGVILSTAEDITHQTQALPSSSVAANARAAQSTV